MLSDGLIITESLTIPPSLLRLFYIVYAMTHNVRLILAGIRSDTKLRVPGTTMGPKEKQLTIHTCLTNKKPMGNVARENE